MPSVPHDVGGVAVVESVIFALKTLVKVAEEESDEALRRTPYLKEESVGEAAQTVRRLMVGRSIISIY